MVLPALITPTFVFMYHNKLYSMIHAFATIKCIVFGLLNHFPHMHLWFIYRCIIAACM